MENQEIRKRNQVLLELMLGASDRAFWNETIGMTEESLRQIDDDAWKNIDTAFIVGHGTSLATAYNAETYLSHIAGLRARALPAYEFRSYPDDYVKSPETTLVIGCSCSGNTVSVVKSLEIARGMGCKTLCLSGDGDIGGAKAAEYRIVADCAIEKRGATSHPYSVSHLFLLIGAYKLSIRIGQSRGVLTEQKAAYWEEQLEKALGALTFLPELSEQMARIAGDARARGAVNQIVLGTGPNHGTMVEGALKICEFIWKLGAGEELEDFAHGRFRELDQITPLMMICPSGASVDKAMDILAGAAIAGSNTVIFTDAPTEAMEKLATTIVRMPALEDEYLTPFVYVFAFWLYGYHYMADAGELVGGARYGLLATDINFKAHFDAHGNHL